MRVQFLVRSGRTAESVTVQSAGLIPRAWADENRIRQVIDNLLNNAGRHGGDQCRIQVRLWKTDVGTIAVEVRDDGAGMPDDIRERAFEPFVKGQDKEEGTGLGLAIVRRILEAHACPVELESRKGKGTTVVFALPSVKRTEDETEDPGPEQEQVDRLRSARVLIVEDDSDTVDFLELALRSEGYSVEMAPDADQAFRCIQRQLPDMAIVDISLPGMDGLEFCRILKDDPSTAGVPICILTARAEDEVQDRARALGCECYLIKPVSLTDLMFGVSRLVRRRILTPHPHS